MSAMGEDTDEPVWQQGQGEKRSNGETEREGSKKPRVNPSEVQGPLGSILRVRLQNFMCHDDLDW